MQFCRSLVLLLTIIYLPHLAGSQSFVGVWKGHISTPEKNLPYEVVIAKNGAGYKGWSMITFHTGKDTVHIFKNLVVEQKETSVKLTEADIIEDNLKENLPRKIKQISELTLSNDYLLGKYKTEVPKNMRSSTGSIELKRVPETELAQSPITEKINKWNIKDALVVTAEQGIAKNTASASTTSASGSAAASVLQGTVPSVSIEPTEIFTDFEGLKLLHAPAILKTYLVKQISVPEKIARPSRFIVPRAFTTIVREQAPVVAVQTKDVPQQTIKTTIKTTTNSTAFAAVENLPTGVLEDRAIENIGTLNINSDSLVFTLYDNGEVDGDTVTVTINGRLVFDKQGLTTAPATKTIYLTPQLGETIELIMYAENLGAISPNTGLLIIQDGGVRREIRFSGDLKKSAGITLQRRL